MIVGVVLTPLTCEGALVAWTFLPRGYHGNTDLPDVDIKSRTGSLAVTGADGRATGKGNLVQRRGTMPRRHRYVIKTLRSVNGAGSRKPHTAGQLVNVLLGERAHRVR